MSFIAARNFATGTQQYLNLSAENYMRPLSIGTSWNRIRIGILFSVGTVSENAWPIRNTAFSIGVSNGVNNTIAALSPGHAFGFSLPAVPSALNNVSFSYNAGTSGNSYMSLTANTLFKYAAGTLTTSGVGSIAFLVPTNTTTGGALARRGIFILDMNKSALVSGNMTQGSTCGAVAHMALDITTSDLYSALEWYATAPTIQGTALTTLALGNSLTFNESVNGPLDTVFVNWTGYTVPLQLYEIAVYRVG